MSDRNVLIDAELLVLLLAGSASIEIIGRHKRLRAYTREDFDLLVEVLRGAPHIIITPHTLTEASNLVRQIGEPYRSSIGSAMKRLVAQVEEVFIEAKAAVEQAEFIRLGLTDSVLLHLSDGAGTLLTSDVDLYLAAMRRGRRVENFNHLREARRTV